MLYECTFILRQDIAVQDVHRISDAFVQILEKGGGAVLKKELWGLRSLAYHIKKNKKGYYIMLIVDASSVAMLELEKNFKINEDVLRYLITRTSKVSDEPSHMVNVPSEYDIAAISNT